MTCAPSKDSDQPGHPPSLIRVFAVGSVGSQVPKVSSCGQGRLLSDWVDAQADLSLCLAHRSFCWFCCAVAQIEVDGLIVCFPSYCHQKICLQKCAIDRTGLVCYISSRAGKVLKQSLIVLHHQMSHLMTK